MRDSAAFTPDGGEVNLFLNDLAFLPGHWGASLRASPDLGDKNGL